jgi:hypothetical protein
MIALADHGIRLRDHRPGEHRTACPECARTKRRSSDTALAVRIDADGTACWCCFRCRWTGTTLEPSRPARRRPPPKAPPQPNPEAERRRELAQEIWRQSETIADGLPFAYLAQRRGIAVWDCDRVRWHPRCPWGAGTAGCIVVPVTDHATDYVVGIWRIRPSMTEPMKSRRMGLGPTKGNAARLFETPGPELIVTEGVEDALSAHALFGGVPAWAALSAGNMAQLVLPPRVEQVLILADRDEPKEDGRQVGLEAAHELAQRLRAEGRGAEVRWSRIGKDANDVLRGTAA